MKVRPLVRLAPKFYLTALYHVASLATTITNNELLYLRPTNQTTGPIGALTPKVQALFEGVVLVAL